MIDNPSVRVIDCRFNLANPGAGQQAWEEGHIPGAVYAHLDNDLSGEKSTRSGRHPIPDKQQLVAHFRDWGINNDTQIVAYDAMGGAMASRLWWLARWLGHENVAVLDGGLPAWQSSGAELDDDVPEYAQGSFEAAASLTSNIDVADLQEMLKQDSVVLIDARDAARFRGEKDEIDAVAGHVPGALNHFFMQSMTENGFFKTPVELRAGFDRYTKEPGRRKIVHMCGSGVTACHNMLAMQHAGIATDLLYIGSWSEWIQDANRPVARGDE